jgi:uncharacterized protein (DUF362 family)
VHTGAGDRIASVVRDELARRVGQLRPRRIVLKPNWVLHETSSTFPIRALVTDPRLIEAAALSCLELFPDAESILIGDCPLQWADWPLMCHQSGLQRVVEKLGGVAKGRIQFRDLRREAFRRANGNFLEGVKGEQGDPRGYREVELGAQSHLEAISNQADLFAVSDYSATITRSNHARGSHRYLVAQSILDGDLFINLPKWKCHAKSGITAALKNVVGINGDKAYLPHFRRGAPKWGGDEYRNEDRWLYWAQGTFKAALQKRSRALYRAVRPGWEILKRMRGIETRLESREASPARFYSGSGSWHGNQTVWRMIHDLNLLIGWMDASATLQSSPVRHYVCIVDGLVSGEGNGPLEPLPRDTDWLIFGEDPFAIDAALAWFMGFDPRRIPVIEQRRQFARETWGRFDFDELEVELDGTRQRVAEAPHNFQFVPPPGWRGHIER